MRAGRIRAWSAAVVMAAMSIGLVACASSTAAEPSPTSTIPAVTPMPALPAAVPVTPVAVRSLRPLLPIHITIPSIGVDSPVVEIDTKYDETGALVWDTAAFAVGHYSRTAEPGEIGNMVMSGHISSQNAGAVFKRLPEIAVGDGIIVSTKESSHFYVVRSVTVVEPEEVKVMEATDEEIITLITCVPDGVYTQRLVVVGMPP